MDNNQLSLDKFIEGLPIGILILDPSLHVKTGNTLAFQLLDVAVEDLVTASFDSVVTDEQVCHALHQIAAGETAKQYMIVERNGIYIKCTIDRQIDDSGEDGSIIMIVEDATGFKQLELLKQDFIQTILHRIRSPLTTLKTSLSMVNSLHRESIPEDVREIVDMSYHEVNRLHVLMNDLRNLFLIETKLAGLDMEIEAFPVADVLDRALGELKKLPSVNDDIQKRISCNGDLDLTIKADFEKVKQVLFILLKNACDFSPEKTPVEINLSQNNNRITIEIKDYGIGISEEAKSYLFTKFFREDNDITRGTEGNGLGLFIARSFVEYMKGSLYFESKKNSGSSFFITLPGE